MKTLLCFLSAFLPGVAGISAADSAIANGGAARPNFLFIAVDDLNDFSGSAVEEPGNFLQGIYPDRPGRG